MAHEGPAVVLSQQLVNNEERTYRTSYLVLRTSYFVLRTSHLIHGTSYFLIRPYFHTQILSACLTQ
jgi:hypothetical protein